MEVTTVILYIILTISGILLIGSVIWFINGIIKISKSVSEIDRPNKTEEVKTQSVGLDLVEAIKQNREQFDLENFRALPYAELGSIEMKATNLWCGLARYIYTDEETFVTWLYEKSKLLEGNQPIDLLETEIGYEQVYILLGKTAAGIPI